MHKELRICIVGAGAIGGVTAGVLVREGFTVQLVTKHEDLAETIRDSGISVSGQCGHFTVPVPAVAGPESLVGKFDYVLIATKADAMADAARGMVPFLYENSRVVSMQNGICEEILAGVVGNDRTTGCVVGWGGTMHEPGRVEMTSGGEFILGYPYREPDEYLEKLAGILGHVVETRITRDILSERYSKLIINSCITTLGALCGLYLGEMLAKRRARILFIEIIREAVAVAGAMKLQIAPAAAGKLDFYKFLAHGPFSSFKRHLIIRMIGMKYRNLKSSSLQSLERGRRTEVDNYNGYISTKGKAFGVATPVNDQLTLMIHEIEEGKRETVPHNFYQIQL